MTVVLIGSVSSSWHSLAALVRNGIAVRGVCGLHERHAGSVSDYRSLRDLAGQQGIDYLAFDRIIEPAVRDFLLHRRPDLLFVIGLSQLVSADVLALPRLGTIGFHPTMLPRMRGRAPVAWTILLNEQPAVTLFFMTDQPDAGDIILQRPLPLLPDDYAADLIGRTNQVLEACITQLAPAIRAGNLPRAPQDHSRATWLGKRMRADGLIDFARAAESIYRLIRASSRPYPGAFTYHRGAELIVWRAAPHERQDHVGTIGQIVAIEPDRGLLVQTGRGLIWLTELQYVGRPDPVGNQQFRLGERLGFDAREEWKVLGDRLDRLEHQGPATSGEGQP
jgi:methionyl-tRNA formyltransferase